MSEERPVSYHALLETIARLHTQPSFRERSARGTSRSEPVPDRPPVAEPGVSGTPVDPGQIERIGRLSEFHRLAKLREHLPWVDLELRPGLAPLFAQYQEEVRPRALNRDEAIEFCRFVERQAAGALAADLAKLDRLRIEVAWGLEGRGSRWRERFDYPVLEAVARLDEPGWPAVEREETWVELTKVPMLPAVTVREKAG